MGIAVENKPATHGDVPGQARCHPGKGPAASRYVSSQGWSQAYTAMCKRRPGAARMSQKALGAFLGARTHRACPAPQPGRTVMGFFGK